MNNKLHPNLKPWIAGQSGNPTGRKLGSKNISTIVRELLEQNADERVLSRTKMAELVDGKPTSYAQAIVFSMLIKALEGNVQAVCWLTEQQSRNYMSEVGDDGLFNASKLIVEVVPSSKSTLD